MRHFSRCFVRVKWAIYLLSFKNSSQILVVISGANIGYKRLVVFYVPSAAMSFRDTTPFTVPWEGREARVYTLPIGN